MKRRYERPSAYIEEFTPNEYVAACGDSEQYISLNVQLVVVNLVEFIKKQMVRQDYK